jgi:hypothetical protein
MAAGFRPLKVLRKKLSLTKNLLAGGSGNPRFCLQASSQITAGIVQSMCWQISE